MSSELKSIRTAEKPTAAEDTWPPSFTLDQEKILNLLTGDRFYSDPSAALREAVLNAVDAVGRRRSREASLQPNIDVSFNRDERSLTISDNGVGMTQDDVSQLFTKVGASAAVHDGKDKSVGEFGIGVVSYFMAADRFTLQTKDAEGETVGLLFTREMLAGGEAKELASSQDSQGTTVVLHLRDEQTYALLLSQFPHWCRDVQGLTARSLPENENLNQGGLQQSDHSVDVAYPEWVERAHLAPVANPTGWEAMTGISTVAVLYRGVFVQEFDVKNAWGIQGSIDVDPKYFKPRLNREGFIESRFQEDVDKFLMSCHPTILGAMARRLAEAEGAGLLDKWTEKRWASLWLSVPRTPPYAEAVRAWDAVFRSVPAFERARGNAWEGISLDELRLLEGEIFLAPLAGDNQNDVTKAALHLLRTTGKIVIRGIQKDRGWMRFAPASFATTADLISKVFADELPALTSIAQESAKILSEIAPVATLYTGPPAVDLANFGNESPPALRLRDRLIINVDNPAGVSIVRDALRENSGPMSLISISARHAYQQLTEVAAVIRKGASEPEALSPIRRRYIRSHLR